MNEICAKALQTGLVPRGRKVLRNISSEYSLGTILAAGGSICNLYRSLLSACGTESPINFFAGTGAHLRLTWAVAEYYSKVRLLNNLATLLVFLGTPE